MKSIPSNSKTQWALGNGKDFIVYFQGAGNIKLKLSSGKYLPNWIDPVTGKVLTTENEVDGGREMIFYNKKESPEILWIRSK
jgi:hypothetical protein